MFFLYFTLRLFLSQGQQPDLALKESDQPFFVLRISAYVKQTALSLKNKCLQRFIASPHKKMLILLLCPFMIVTMALYLDQEPLMHRPWVIGHRGDSHAPENSLEGIRSAALHGADFAEIDIQLTADQQLAVFHDNTTSRLAHEDLTVKTSTMKELQQLVLFDRDQEFRIPSLQEAVACAKQQRSSFGLLIELKPQPGQAEKMVKQLIRIIERYDFEERASTDPNSGFHNGASDYVGRIKYNNMKWINFASRFRLSQEDLSLSHMETSAIIGNSDNFINIGHIWSQQFIDTQTIADDINEITAGVGIKLTNRWSLRFNAIYNMTFDMFQRHSGGIFYNHPCYYLSAEYRHDNAVKEDYVGTTTFQFRFGMSIDGQRY